MAIEPDSPLPEKPDRLAIRLPRPLWIGAAAAALVVVAAGLRIGIPACRRELAIRQIERFGGEIEWRQGGPKWIRQWFGAARNPVFDIVYGANLDNSQNPDTALGQLGPLKNLERLRVNNPRLTDAGVEHLEDLHGLQVILLIRTRVGDTGLRHLAGLTELRQLHLDGTKVTDAGLIHLAALPQLQFLSLFGTDVTDAAIPRLKHTLPKLAIQRSGLTVYDHTTFEQGGWEEVDARSVPGMPPTNIPEWPQ